ncbi:MAG: 16S rRNA (adenine(1518)-N(6)/adenine(1519)-N(6))-dimethyltransferase RsmA [Eubacteriales bacterium]|nr:16S rRNA (adenine(1518)-N(6)/adenine(1519)-N(6))-dimethyltransferase RsmA [Eubacteriales bacterium]MDD4444392.1 16S rRNA (adenine(1518)-N(6)/adenine(1519)-N(6))-dimethyltransferase RsmA [Eubacteriales bacterium]
MGRLHTAGGIRAIGKKYDFRTAKRLGQNFLTDLSVVDQIVESSEAGPRDLVIEIGPGMGVLTVQAARAAGKVAAIEVDAKLIPILRETLAPYANVTVIHEDVLKTDLPDLIERERILPDGTSAEQVRILGNLPYYITTPILMKLLEDRVGVQSITIMVQKEVAMRIAAPPGSRTYGALSVAVQYFCEIDYVVTVPKEAFFPAPKVDSAVIHLRLRTKPPVELLSEKLFFECVKKGFGQRRKTLHNALTGICDLDKEATGKLLEVCGIDPIRRAETLSLEEFAALANRLAQPGLHIR